MDSVTVYFKNQIMSLRGGTTKQSFRANIDNPQTTIERRKIISQKYFLQRIYTEFYNRLNSALKDSNRKGTIVELGSGGGFIKKIIPKVKTSDILKLPDVDMQFSVLKMPFKNKSVNAFIMIDVFHHISDIKKFLNEINRCLKKGGQIIMIEPSNTLFGRIIYKYFHHELYNATGKWSFKSSGPLSGANSALAWIVFIRDRKIFEKEFPMLKIIKIEAHTPFKYLISGGFSYRQLLPDFFYPATQFLELLLCSLNRYLGIFYTIEVTKIK